jgi:uncharacterized protein YcbX
MPKIVRIWIYPIKSLDGLRVPFSEILRSGALTDDRRWALYGQDEQVLNAKKSADFHTLRVHYQPGTWEADFRSDKVGESLTADLRTNWQGPLNLFSRHFEQEVHIRENQTLGFPDDVDAPGPTIVSTGSIRRVAEWFSISEDEVRRRFRANIEIDVDEPFWEDRLLGQDQQKQAFRIGSAHFWAVHCCQRCVVPTRDSQTGVVISGFQKRFAELREAELSATTPREHFNHYYRYSVNTQIDPATRSWRIGIGDDVVIGE